MDWTTLFFSHPKCFHVSHPACLCQASPFDPCKTVILQSLPQGTVAFIPASVPHTARMAPPPNEPESSQPPSCPLHLTPAPLGPAFGQTLQTPNTSWFHFYEDTVSGSPEALSLI